MTALKATLAGLASLTFFSGAAVAQGAFEPAEGSWYASAFGGATFVNDDVNDLGLDGGNLAAELDADAGYFVGAAVGGRLPFKSFGLIRTRAELEVSYQNASISLTDGTDTGISLDTLFILINTVGELQWQDEQAIIPYIGGGLGVGIVSANGTNLVGVDTSESRFSTTNSLGLLFPNGRTEFFAEGRYFRIWNVGEDDLVDGVNVDGFNLLVGGRLKFR